MLIWTGLRRVISAIQRLFNSASFSAPLTHSLVLERGTGSPAFTRASTATFRDWEGVLRTVPSGCARFEGARMVRNVMRKSEDFSGAEFTKTNCTVAKNLEGPDGVANSACTVTATGASALLYDTQGITPASCTKAITSVYLKRITGTGTVRISANGANTNVTVALTTSWQRFEASATTLVSGTFPAILIATSGDLIGVAFWQEEDVTGQADQTASEYVSVGVLSAPYHGAGVDGVEFFNTDRDGAAIPAATNTGYLAEGARTQILATADIRDMTTAAWILGATMTRARTSIGADGAANSATRLTGGAVAATNTCYTTITAAASSRTYSALVKRVTGTGPVRIVQTGTEIDISSLINSSTYTLVELNASILNAVMGFKIDTNGDAIDVDFNQFEAGAFASSRIAAAVTRAADVLTYSSAGNVSAAAGWVYVEATVPINNGAPQIQIDDGSNNNRILIDDGNSVNGGTRFFIQSGGGVEALINDFSSSANTFQKRCVTWATNYAQSSQGGLLSAADTSVTPPVSITQIGIGGANGVAVAPCTIRNVRIGQRQLSASEMQAITA